MRKEAEELLKKSSLTGEEFAKALLLHLVSTIGPKRRPLFSAKELDSLQERMSVTGQEDMDALNLYSHLNSALPDLRSFMDALKDELLALSIVLANTLDDFYFSESVQYFYNSAPLFLTASDYDELKHTHKKAMKDKQLSFSDVVYMALLYYLPKTSGELSALIEEHLEAQQRKGGRRKRIVPAAISRGLFKDITQVLSEEEAELLHPLILKKARTAIPTGEALNKIEEQIQKEVNNMNSDLLKVDSLDDYANLSSKGFQHASQVEEDALDEYRITLAEEKIESLKGMKKQEFLNLPNSKENLTKYFFFFAGKGNDEDDREKGYYAFETLYPSLLKALIADIKKKLPEIKTAAKTPLKPCIELGHVCDQELYDSNTYLLPSTDDLMELLSTKDKERAEKYGICLMLKDSLQTSFSKQNLSIEGSKNVKQINHIYDHAERLSTERSFEADSDLTQEVAIIESFRNNLPLLKAYNYFIDQFKIAQKIEEIEHLKVDTSALEGNILYCEFALKNAIHALNSVKKYDLSKQLLRTLKGYNLKDAELSKQEKEELSQLASNTKKLCERSLITSIALSLNVQ